MDIRLGKCGALLNALFRLTPSGCRFIVHCRRTVFNSISEIQDEIRRPTVNFNELWRIVEKDDGRVWDVVGIDKVSIRSNWGVTVKASGEILPPPEPETFEAKGAQEESPEKQELPSLRGQNEDRIESSEWETLGAHVSPSRFSQD